MFDIHQVACGHVGGHIKGTCVCVCVCVCTCVLSGYLGSTCMLGVRQCKEKGQGGCECVWARTNTHTHTHTHTYTHTHTRTHAHIYTHAHTLTHTDTHATCTHRVSLKVQSQIRGLYDVDESVISSRTRDVDLLKPEVSTMMKYQPCQSLFLTYRKTH